MSSSRSSQSHRVEQDDDHPWTGYKPRSFDSFSSSPPDPSRDARASSSFSWIGDKLAIELDSPIKKTQPTATTSHLIARPPPEVSPYLTQHSTSNKTGLGVITTFSSHPAPAQDPLSLPSRSYQTDRSQVQFNGTGPHDGLLARSRTNTKQFPFQVEKAPVAQQSANMPKPKKQNQEEHGLGFTKVVDMNKKASNSNTMASQPIGQADSGSQYFQNNKPTLAIPYHLPQYNPLSSQKNGKLHITDAEKLAVLLECIKYEKEYLALPHGGPKSDSSVWIMILQDLAPDLRAKFTTPTDLKNQVHEWCASRRDKLRNGTLPPPQNVHRVLDRTVDQWNQIWHQRWCRKRGITLHSPVVKVEEKSGDPSIKKPGKRTFDSPVEETKEKDADTSVEKIGGEVIHGAVNPSGETTAERPDNSAIEKIGGEAVDETVNSSGEDIADKPVDPSAEHLEAGTVLSLVRQELPILLKRMLQEREKELETLARPPILARDSNIEDYRKYLNSLKDRIPAGGIMMNPSDVLQTEALLSLVHDLTPGLERSLLQQMNPVETQTNGHNENAADEHQGEVAQTLGQNNGQPDPNDSRDFSESSKSSDSSDSSDLSDSEDSDEEDDDTTMNYHHDQVSPLLGEPRTRSRSRSQKDVVQPSTETLTPETTPTTLNKLTEFEKAHRHYLKIIAAGKPEFTLDQPKRKSEEACTPHPSKRARIDVGHGETPNSVASTFSFPSVSRLALSMRPKAELSSSQTTQDTSSAVSDSAPMVSDDNDVFSRSASRATSGLTNLSDPTYTPTPQEKVSRPPPLTTEAPRENIFVKPRAKDKGASEAGPSNRREKKTRNRSHSTGRNEADRTDDDDSLRNFRESTEDFSALTPSAREKMLFRAVRSMCKKSKRE